MTRKISRQSTLQQNLKYYFTGLPCKYGHISVNELLVDNVTNALLINNSYHQQNKKQLTTIKTINNTFETLPKNII